MTESRVRKVYAATNLKDQEQAYDEWAAEYERDLCAAGYRSPLVMAAVFARFVPLGTKPILDAGCGGGIQVEPLAAAGYTDFTGIDLSAGMLQVARNKGIYQQLHQATLGEPLDFPDDHFAAILSTGAITPGHATAHCFEELLRIAQPGACILFSLREDAEMHNKYHADYHGFISQLEDAGRWQHVFQSKQFQTMPYGEPEVVNCIQVYKKPV